MSLELGPKFKELLKHTTLKALDLLQLCCKTENNDKATKNNRNITSSEISKSSVHTTGLQEFNKHK